MPFRTAEVTTRDGRCPVTIHTPDASGPHAGPFPAALMFMDAPGIRPSLQEIAGRLADAGYVVMLPDLYYRGGAYPPVDPKALFGDPEAREAHRARFQAPLTPDKAMADAASLLEALAAEPDVAPGPIGVFGYCMGGRLALLAAGTFGVRVAVSASYHPGGLATDDASSPHRLADRIRARVYVAGATADKSFPDAMRDRLATALADAGVVHEIETYPAKHGWVPRDMPSHDAAEAEHHWQTLVPLFDAALKGARPAAG